MEARIYVEIKTAKPGFVVLFEDGSVQRGAAVLIEGPSEAVHDPTLGKHILLTRSPVRVTPHTQ